MVPSTSQLKEELGRIGKNPFLILKLFRLVFLFFLLYLIHVMIYAYVFREAYAPPLDEILTAPFSPSENFGYASPSEGLAYNFGVVALIIATSEFYERLVKGERQWFDWTDSSFLMGAFASYLMSALLFLTRGFASAGTSIIGTCVGLSLLVVSARDFAREVATPRNNHSKLTMSVSYGVAVLAAILLAGYFVGNGSAGAHLLGTFLFAPLLVLFISLKKVDASEDSLRNRIYVAVVLLIVLLIGFQQISYLMINPLVRLG